MTLLRSHSATALGSNLTEVPTRKLGIFPALAILYTVIGLTASRAATSLAVIARLIASIRCGSEQLVSCIFIPNVSECRNGCSVEVLRVINDRQHSRFFLLASI
jgi:hypothetical protein